VDGAAAPNEFGGVAAEPVQLRWIRAATSRGEPGLPPGGSGVSR